MFESILGNSYESYGLVPFINMALLVLAVIKLVTMVVIIRKLKILISRSQLEVRRLSEAHADVLSFVKSNGNHNGNGHNGNNHSGTQGGK